MKHFSSVIFAWLFASGVHAASQDPNQCLGNLHDASDARVVSEVVVWVNENGDPVHTETNHGPASTSAQGNPTTLNIPSTSLYTPTTKHDDTHTILPQTSLQDEPLPTTLSNSDSMKRLQNKAPHHDAPPPHPHPHPHPNTGPPKHANPPKGPHRQFGISYSPYNANRGCKTQEQVNKDLDALPEYSFIRIYGTDCDQTKLVATAARQHKMQVFGGIYDLTGFPASLDVFKEAATDEHGKTDWSVFHTIAVGNELVNGGHSSPGEVTGAVVKARSYLRAQGYQGPVVTVDTFSILLKHPELCHVSDYCAANCHAFFDATQQPHNAGPYALEQMHSVSAAAGGKHTMITESGWPHAGGSNGKAVPSPENQRVAVESLRRSFAHQGDDLVLFTAFDDLWKDDNRYTFNAERFWGIHK